MSSERDCFHGVHQYMGQILMSMEQNLMGDEAAPLFPDSAVQATVKSFEEAINESKAPDEHVNISGKNCINSATDPADNSVEATRISNPGEIPSSLTKSSYINQFSPPSSDSLASSSSITNVNLLVPSVNPPFSSIPILESSFPPSSHACASPNNITNTNPLIQAVNSSVYPPLVFSSYSNNQYLSQSNGEQEKVTQIISNNDELNHCAFPSDDNSDLRYKKYSLKGLQRKKHYEEESNRCSRETQSSKQLARCSEEAAVSEMFDKVSLCPDYNTVYAEVSQSKESKAGGSKGRTRDRRRKAVSLKKLLIECALSTSALPSHDTQRANKVLKKIRQCSSPHGDGTSRLAHYIANAIEARIAGTGTELYADFCKRGLLVPDTLKAYQAYFTAVPFQKMSNIFANKAIYYRTLKAARLHIIDFGILHGFQWPCIIQALSSRPGGPPKLRITGIDFPEPGFRPLEKVENTGSHLANYCKRLQVPFEYNPIAKEWDSIEIEDLKIDKDETIVVNCLYRLRQVPDAVGRPSGPRDMILNLIRRINPELFVHGILNGTYGSAYFPIRFQEALNHFASLFDMFENTFEKDDKNRLVFEKERLAKEIMNVVACEGTKRIERPETYKQWTSRITRAGFVQLPLNKKILEEVEAKVRQQYHKGFGVAEENKWMVQKWKGRVIYALSLWKLTQE